MKAEPLTLEVCINKRIYGLSRLRTRPARGGSPTPCLSTYRCPAVRKLTNLSAKKNRTLSILVSRLSNTTFQKASVRQDAIPDSLRFYWIFYFLRNISDIMLTLFQKIDG